MNIILRRVLALSVLAIAGAGAPAMAGVVAFTDSYLGARGGPACDTAYDIVGAAPDDGLQHPVFVFAVGTHESFDNAEAHAAVDAMAAKGFVAATVRYNSDVFGNCTQLAQKAACMFQPDSASSAVARLCARGDCSKGIVTGGFSQGAVMATLAKNYDSRVAAAWGMGAFNRYASFNLAACMSDRKHSLPAARLRIVDGERDVFGGATASGVRAAATAVTGKACAGNAYACLRSNGSGWLMVKNAQVSDHSADHCFYRKAGDCDGSQNVVDPKWKTGAQPWALPASLAWLRRFTTP